MKKLILLLFLFYSPHVFAESDDYFFIGKMESYNNDFTLYFKSREKAILARGENNNYINDYPQDLYIYDHKTKTDLPMFDHSRFGTDGENLDWVRQQAISHYVNYYALPD